MTRTVGFHHLPGSVTAAIYNPSNQPRPVHRLDCPEANKRGKREDYWDVFEGEKAIRQVLAERRPHHCLEG
ncbi:MAG: hypothetical protein F4090_04760 [Nitrospira sp. SB0672_bin_25]|nr:hypothetical protein [Nitrospira sp. SB0666_bin_27]MYJ54205.1 hypothetical protein [Nitrospira sp. SB0672_bin_25]